MSKARTFKVICHWGRETGFRLGGAEVAPVASVEEFNREIEEILEKKEVGILALPWDMEGWISERNRKKLKKALTPLLARYIYPEKWGLVPEAEKFTEDMAFRAIGYRIQIRI